MKLIDPILIQDLGFKTTTKDRCTYIKKVDGGIIVFLKQVDNFCTGTGYFNKQGAKNIYSFVVSKIQFQFEHDKGDMPFEYLGLVKNYNGADLVQSKRFIGMNCSNYINCSLKSYGQDVTSDELDSTSTTVTNSRTWDLWMDNIGCGNDNTDDGNANDGNTNVTNVPTASVTTFRLYSVNTSTSSPDLSYDELVT